MKTKLFKKVISALSVASIVSSMLVTPVMATVLFTYDMENATPSTGLALPASRATSEVTTEDKYEGAKSLKLTAPNANTLYYITFKHQNFTAGKVYKATARVKATSGKGLFVANNQNIVTLQTLNGVTGFNGANDSYNLMKNQEDASLTEGKDENGWVEVSNILYANATYGTPIGLQFICGSAGESIYIDNVKLETIPLEITGEEAIPDEIKVPLAGQAAAVYPLDFTIGADGKTFQKDNRAAFYDTVFNIHGNKWAWKGGDLKLTYGLADNYAGVSITEENVLTVTSDAVPGTDIVVNVKYGNSVVYTKTATLKTSEVLPPVAEGVTVEGGCHQGEIILLSYDYVDGNDDAENGTTVQWFAEGISEPLTDTEVVTEATGSRYEITEADVGRKIYAVVTPKNDTDGAGASVPSSAVTILPKVGVDVKILDMENANDLGLWNDWSVGIVPACEQTTDEKYSGNASLKLTAANANTVYYIGLHQIPLEAGAVYRATAKVKANGGKGIFSTNSFHKNKMHVLQTINGVTGFNGGTDNYEIFKKIENISLTDNQYANGWAEVSSILYSTMGDKQTLGFSFMCDTAEETIYIDDITITKIPLECTAQDTLPDGIVVPEAGQADGVYPLDLTIGAYGQTFPNDNAAFQAEVERLFQWGYSSGDLKLTYELAENYTGVSITENNELTVTDEAVPGSRIAVKLKYGNSDSVAVAYTKEFILLEAGYGYVGDVQITGGTNVGDTLTVSCLHVGSGTPKYQWYRSGSEDEIGAAIEGATENTYTITDNDEWKYVYAVITPENEGEPVGDSAASQKIKVGVSYTIVKGILNDDKTAFKGVTIKRNRTTDKDAVLIAALYKDEELLEVSVVDLLGKTTKGEQADIMLEKGIAIPSGVGYKFKMFVWDMAEDEIEPLAYVKEFIPVDLTQAGVLCTAEPLAYTKRTNIDNVIYQNLQGATTDGEYIYAYQYSFTTGTGVIIKHDAETLELVQTSAPLALGHGNDMTYNSKINQIVVVHNKDKNGNGEDCYNYLSFVDPETLTIVAKITDLTFGMSSIDYVEEADQYIVQTDNGHFKLLDSDLSAEKSFQASVMPLGVGQNIVVTKDYIYALQHNSAAIYMYDWNGNYINTIAIDGLHNDIAYEPESLILLNDEFYLAALEDFVSGDTTGNSGAIYKLNFNIPE